MVKSMKVSKKQNKSIKNKREFYVESAYTEDGCPIKFKNKLKTRKKSLFISRDHATAARKAGSLYCNKLNLEEECILYLNIKETTRNSKEKLLKYKIYKKKLNKKGLYGNQYDIIAKAYKHSSSKKHKNTLLCKKKSKKKSKKSTRK